MTETRNTGDKTIHVPQQRKTLGLKPRGVERDTVRQSFSHGRTNTVQVERKKRRIVLPGETAKAETPAPAPAARQPEPVKITTHDTVAPAPPKTTGSSATACPATSSITTSGGSSEAEKEGTCRAAQSPASVAISASPAVGQGPAAQVRA